MIKLEQTKEFFKGAIKNELLKFEQSQNWLTIYHRETLSQDGNSWKWTMLCAQNLNDYKDSKELTNRITLMLAEALRSACQSYNMAVA